MAEMRREDSVIIVVPALSLARPDVGRLLRKLIPILLSILTPPPDQLLDVRHRLGKILFYRSPERYVM